MQFAIYHLLLDDRITLYWHELPKRSRHPTTHSSRRRFAASKIDAILEPDFVLIVFPIYWCGAAEC
jgi:hypothetical protein